MARIKFFNDVTGKWEYADNSNYIAPVQSVNGKTGAVSLSAQDVGGEQGGTVNAHNSNQSAHPHILDLIAGLDNKFMRKTDISIKKAQLALEDGTTVLIDVVVASDGTTIQKFTNQIPLSIGTDGSIYNGIGYKTGYRLSSSGGEKDVGGEGANGSMVTGFIPVRGGDVVRIFGIPWYRANPENSVDGSANYFAAYDMNFSLIGSVTGNLGNYAQWLDDVSKRPAIDVVVEEGEITSDLITFTLPTDANIKYVRMSCCSNKSNLLVDPSSAVITVNEPVV